MPNANEKTPCDEQPLYTFLCLVEKAQELKMDVLGGGGETIYAKRRRLKKLGGNTA